MDREHLHRTPDSIDGELRYSPPMRNRRHPCLMRNSPVRLGICSRLPDCPPCRRHRATLRSRLRQVQADRTGEAPSSLRDSPRAPVASSSGARHDRHPKGSCPGLHVVPGSRRLPIPPTSSHWSADEPGPDPDSDPPPGGPGCRPSRRKQSPHSPGQRVAWSRNSKAPDRPPDRRAREGSPDHWTRRQRELRTG